MKLLGLLRSRNRALARLIELSNGLALRLEQSDWSALAPKLSARESMFKALDLFERDLGKMSQTDLEAELVSDDVRKKVSELISSSEEMKKKLTELNDVLIRLIENEQSNTLKELTKSKTFAKTVSKFKSAPAEAQGEEVDQKL